MTSVPGDRRDILDDEIERGWAELEEKDPDARTRLGRVMARVLFAAWRATHEAAQQAHEAAQQAPEGDQ